MQTSHTDFEHGHTSDDWVYTKNRLILFTDGRVSSVTTQ